MKDVPSVHSFDVQDATKYGVECAVILYHIRFWLQKNLANEKHFYDGRVWTDSSVSAFTRIFPYLSRDQIYRRLAKLEESGILIKGNYNKNTHDQTNWYSVREIAYSISQNHKFEFANSQDRSGEITNSSINPDDIKDIRRDNKTKKADLIEDQAEQIYHEYPRKVGKQKAIQSIEKALKKIEFDDLLPIVMEYAEAVEGQDKQFIPHPTTWFNQGRWEDDREEWHAWKSKTKTNEQYETTGQRNLEISEYLLGRE